MSTKLRLSYGPAASNTYDDDTHSKLTLDWSFDRVYFIYRQEKGIVFSIGERPVLYEMELLDTLEKISLFKKLAEYTLEQLRHSPVNSNKALDALKRMVMYSQKSYFLTNHRNFQYLCTENV